MAVVDYCKVIDLYAHNALQSWGDGVEPSVDSVEQLWKAKTAAGLVEPEVLKKHSERLNLVTLMMKVLELLGNEPGPSLTAAARAWASSVTPTSPGFPAAQDWERALRQVIEYADLVIGDCEPPSCGGVDALVADIIAAARRVESSMPAPDLIREEQAPHPVKAPADQPVEDSRSTAQATPEVFIIDDDGDDDDAGHVLAAPVEPHDRVEAFGAQFVAVDMECPLSPGFHELAQTRLEAVPTAAASSNAPLADAPAIGIAISQGHSYGPASSRIRSQAPVRPYETRCVVTASPFAESATPARRSAPRPFQMGPVAAPPARAAKAWKATAQAAGAPASSSSASPAALAPLEAAPLAVSSVALAASEPAQPAPLAPLAPDAAEAIFDSEVPMETHRQYMSWTKEEEERLIHGYKKFQAENGKRINWEGIRRHCNLMHRKGTQLREKWRNLHQMNLI